MDRYVKHVAGRGRPTMVTLATYLSRFRARNLAAYPSQERMAKKLGVSVSTIYRWTKKLEELDLLDVTRHRARPDHITGQFRRRTNRYRCRFAKSKRDRTEAKPQVRPTGQMCPVNVPCRDVSADVVPVVASPDVGPPPESGIPPPWTRQGMSIGLWLEQQRET
jgi:hypothetical protein